MTRTTIHIPERLPDAIDRKAKATRVTRSRHLRRAFEREIGRDGEWSDGFFEALTRTEIGETIEDLVREVRARRRSKNAPDLRGTTWR